MDNGVMFGILINILLRKKVTRRYLAEKFEISERSVARYIDRLAESGIPIYSLRGPLGGYSISAEFQFDKNFFTKEERSRIITCLRSVEQFDDRINSSIIDKLTYTAKRAKDEQYFLNTDSIIIDSAPWNNTSSYRAKIETLQKAIADKNTVEFVYVDRYEMRTSRLFDPYKIVLKESIWYVYGWCHKRCDFRLFKLARITALNDTDLHFEEKPNDVYEKLKGNFDDIELINIEIEFASTILGDIEEWLGFDSIVERGAKYVAHASVYSGRVLVNKLLSFGASIKILSPAFLREEVLYECKRILRNAGEY
ncbi:MAG: YafY family transcriptional regulator [Clostridia bacterium]|nr:YafY family transcriptional regulator [Clostridia bacterium]